MYKMQFNFHKTLSKLVAALLLTSAASSHADIIQGAATDYNSTTEVGKRRDLSPNVASNPGLNDEYIKYYIPLNPYNDPNAPYTYGVDYMYNDYYGYYTVAGEKKDTGYVSHNTNNSATILDMFVHFVVPEGQVGESIKVTFRDLDLEPTNDPNYFNERLFLGGSQYNQGNIQEASYDSWAALNNADSNGLTYNVQYIDGAPVPAQENGYNQPNDYMTLTISGLNITSGDYWFRMGFQAYSSYSGKLRNTAEYLKAEMTTATYNANVSEASSIALAFAAFGLFGFAQTRRRKSGSL